MNMKISLTLDDVENFLEPVVAPTVTVDFKDDGIVVDVQGGERIWIERVNGVTMVRCYDQSHDEPVSLALGKYAITIDTADYDGRLAP
ncbi:MAG: hypothetical protein LPK02_07220 [Rhodobacterales bacterium]|nr:hypothetical protein [Rhodobacterales bacterium]